LNQALASQTPALGTATELLAFHGGEGAERFWLGTLNIDKTGNALATAPTISKLSLQAVKLDPFPKGHLSQVFPGVALDVEALTQKTNHWHGHPATWIV
jgi:hypothetical protein